MKLRDNQDNPPSTHFEHPEEAVPERIDVVQNVCGAMTRERLKLASPELDPEMEHSEGCLSLLPVPFECDCSTRVYEETNPMVFVFDEERGLEKIIIVGKLRDTILYRAPELDEGDRPAFLLTSQPEGPQ